jgi:hypothetical protein
MKICSAVLELLQVTETDIHDVANKCTLQLLVVNSTKNGKNSKYMRGGAKIMPSNFLTKCNCNNNEIYMDDSYIFCNHETIFPQSLHHFQHTLATLSKMLYASVVKFFASNLEHIMNGKSKTLTNCNSASIQFILTQTLKMSFSFKIMPGLTAACAHGKQTQKCDGLFFPILLTAQIRHPSTTTSSDL